jgi:predicted metalloendopeptidase
LAFFWQPSREPCVFFAVFDGLDISEAHYLTNIVNHRSFARKMELKDFFESPVRGMWSDFSQMAHIATVNAYYNQATNTMVVPIGMLQPPLFWSRPKSLTFGAFGIVVGKYTPAEDASVL